MASMTLLQLLQELETLVSHLKLNSPWFFHICYENFFLII